MADKPIKVIILEGDFASLTAYGFCMAISLQLQQSCLSLSDAMWTAKSTNGGFSVSLFWPTPAPELKSDAQVKRKRKRRRRAKASKVVSLMILNVLTIVILFIIRQYSNRMMA